MGVARMVVAGVGAKGKRRKKGRHNWYQLVPAKKGGGSADGVDGVRVVMGWQGVACHVGVTWRDVARRVGVAWGSVAAGALHAALRQRGGVLRIVLRRHGGSAGSCVTWWGLGVCWVRVAGRGESAGGGVLRAVSGWRGGWWQLGLACRVEVAWWVGRVLACHVGSARWVGGGGAGWRGFAFSRVLRAMLGWQGGLAVAECRGRMEVARVHEWPAMSKVLRAVLGGRVGGGGVLRAMSGWRVGAGTNGSGSRARGDSNGLQR
ncbi:hypothetical protein EDB83DRAFT_2312814 [Lactarius deliciosus]|nr:hypothetical protein EDB83DRAFT_2312814 [Lactarius deliciosus]